MKLSTRARYALRMMIDIHRNTVDGKPVHLRQVAERTQLSRGYLEQMVVSLKNAGLLRGICGRRGGYLLAKPAETIRVAEIIESVIGPISVVNCVTTPESCNLMKECNCHLLWCLVSQHIRRDLNAVSLAEISTPAWAEKITKELEALEAGGEFKSKPAETNEETLEMGDAS
jgi:Rrf2 family iron-sulfur cluster assembly transcriptional regulator